MNPAASLILLLSIIAYLTLGINADSNGITCNASNHCPETSPCCSQYGVCGLGGLCLGGCDVRFSYNLSACMPMPIMLSFDTKFDDLSKVKQQEKYFGNSSEAEWLYTGAVAEHSNALLLQMPANSGGSVVSSTKYLLYGNVKLRLKTSRGAGVITAFILFSDVQDEIDWEYVGYNLTQVQTNYYSLGTLNWTNLNNFSALDVFANYHTYELDWKPDAVTWLIDGQVHRVLKRNDTYNATLKRYEYPLTPLRIQMSLWPGGASLNAPGTIEWAGGPINWDSEDIKNNGYYYAYLESVLVKTYDLLKSIPKKTDPAYPLKDFNACLYNLTDGNESDLYLTNRATWLNGLNANGFNPGNFNGTSPDTPQTTLVTSDGQVLTVVQTRTINVATGAVKGGPDANGGGGVEGYNLANGFVQNAKSTSSGTDTPTSSSKKGSSNSKAEAVSLGGWFILFALGMLLC